jgi:DNA polymerase III alpha subunit
MGIEGAWRSAIAAVRRRGRSPAGKNGTLAPPRSGEGETGRVAAAEDYATLGLSLKRHPLSFLRAELAGEGLVTAAELAHLPVDRRLSIAGIVLIRQRPGSANGVVFITIEDETGIANLIVWPAILERFRRAALGATLLRCTGKLQREQSVIHVVAERLDDLTVRLNTLRDRTGEDAPRPAAKPPFAVPVKAPGYDIRDIVIPSRNFR